MAKNGGPSNRKLTTPQRRAIAGLLAARSVAAAAEVSNCSERSVYRWLSENELFQQELAKRETALIDQTLAHLAGELSVDIGTLADLRDDKTVSASTRLRAALARADLLLRLSELRNVLDRIARLEEVFYAQLERQAKGS